MGYQRHPLWFIFSNFLNALEQRMNPLAWFILNKGFEGKHADHRTNTAFRMSLGWISMKQWMYVIKWLFTTLLSMVMCLHHRWVKHGPGLEETTAALYPNWMNTIDLNTRVQIPVTKRVLRQKSKWSNEAKYPTEQKTVSIFQKVF